MAENPMTNHPTRAEGGAETFWNGEPTPCKRVIVRVGHSMRPTWWCAELEGREREAVFVEYGSTHYFLDNKDGSGWAKVLAGGGPEQFHRSLPDDSEILREAP